MFSFRVFLLLVIPLISGCWHPMDLSPAAMTKASNHMHLSYVDQLRESVDHDETEELDLDLPES